MPHPDERAYSSLLSEVEAKRSFELRDMLFEFARLFD
jgi:hypothetical protein